MERLKENIEEIESAFKANKAYLLKLKITAIFLGVGGLIFSYIKLINFKNKYHYSWFELNLAQLVVVPIVLLPLLLAPLYRFLSDRKFNQINWDIKTSIFKGVINKYDMNYKISFKGFLPDLDINNLKLGTGILTFVYGDDLIYGTINNIKFRMSEIHSSGLIKRRFDGLIGVLIFNSISGDILSESYSSKLPDNVEIRVIGNKIYILQKGLKNHFEFRIKKGKVNKKNLVEDYNYFDEFVSIMNEVSLMKGN